MVRYGASAPPISESGSYPKKIRQLLKVNNEVLLIRAVLPQRASAFYDVTQHLSGLML
jgi:hypothetical protein